MVLSQDGERLNIVRSIDILVLKCRLPQPHSPYIGAAREVELAPARNWMRMRMRIKLQGGLYMYIPPIPLISRLGSFNIPSITTKLDNTLRE